MPAIGSFPLVIDTPFCGFWLFPPPLRIEGPHRVPHFTSFPDTLHFPLLHGHFPRHWLYPPLRIDDPHPFLQWPCLLQTLLFHLLHGSFPRHWLYPHWLSPPLRIEGLHPVPHFTCFLETLLSHLLYGLLQRRWLCPPLPRVEGPHLVRHFTSFHPTRRLLRFLLLLCLGSLRGSLSRHLIHQHDPAIHSPVKISIVTSSGSALRLLALLQVESPLLRPAVHEALHRYVESRLGRKHGLDHIHEAVLAARLHVVGKVVDAQLHQLGLDVFVAHADALLPLPQLLRRYLRYVAILPATTRRHVRTPRFRRRRNCVAEYDRLLMARLMLTRRLLVRRRLIRRRLVRRRLVR
ncbi:hypothetical protein BZA05DRAFT_389549 [Tricharina praecox]|uniref:uncharacterized protein n=1 Tax=Tricharina praecox TaxID=43433 RepID=UPI00221FAE30|nr:uncharacterized protein BZA05DRAFT_389549 [Tricharina praecox]KAI5855757.1 hypothetical protein BZA05DRAFT_389549 [Tricharina praecox]